MRWLFIFIMIFNGIVYWWYSYQSRETIGVEVGAYASKMQVGEGTPGLVLLNELPSASVKPPADIAEQNTALSAPEQTVAYEERFDHAELADKESALPGDVLLESHKSESLVGVVEESPPLEQVDPVCGFLGAFNDVVTAKQFHYRLSTVELEGSVKKEIVAADTIFWVYLEPLSSRRAALTVLRKLQAEKIDSFVITEGEFSNGISLGFFKHKKSAKRVQNDRIKGGYDARLLPKQKTRAQFWVVLQPDQLSKLSAALFKELSKDFEILQNKKNPCEQVAPMENIE